MPPLNNMASDPPAIHIQPTVSAGEGNNNNNNNGGSQESAPSQPRLRWKRILGVKDSADSEGDDDNETPKEKWTMGILNDPQTEEVPGELLRLYAATEDGRLTR